MMRLVLMVAFVILCHAAEAKIPRSKQVIAQFKSEQPCPANGNRYGPCPGYQIDHVTPLKCKGEDAPVNMQWLTIADHKEKTKREASWCRH